MIKLYKYDLHVHARPSRHGPGAIQNYINAGVAAGLDGMVFTEHSHQEGLIDLADFQWSAPDGFFVGAAQEVTTSDYGDVLVYGATEAIPKGLTLANDLAAGYAGARVLAHPMWSLVKDKSRWHYFVDAVEILNGHPRRRGKHCAEMLEYWHETKCAGTGGGDAHHARHVGSAYTLTPHRLTCMSDLVSVLMEGQVLPCALEA